MSKTITCTQVNEWIENNENFKLIEILGQKQYDEFHLPNAICVPFEGNFENTIKQSITAKDQKIVVYGWDQNDSKATQAASKLTAMGYTNVCCLQEGKKAWKEAGHPVNAGVGAAA